MLHKRNTYCIQDLPQFGPATAAIAIVAAVAPPAPAATEAWLPVAGPCLLLVPHSQARMIYAGGTCGHRYAKLSLCELSLFPPSPSPCLFLFLSLSLYLSFSLILALSLSFSLFLSVSLSLPLPLSLSLSLSLRLSVHTSTRTHMQREREKARERHVRVVQPCELICLSRHVIWQFGCTLHMM